MAQTHHLFPTPCIATHPWQIVRLVWLHILVGQWAVNGCLICTTVSYLLLFCFMMRTAPTVSWTTDAGIWSRERLENSSHILDLNESHLWLCQASKSMQQWIPLKNCFSQINFIKSICQSPIHLLPKHSNSWWSSHLFPDRSCQKYFNTTHDNGRWWLFCGASTMGIPAASIEWTGSLDTTIQRECWFHLELPSAGVSGRVPAGT